MPKIHEEAPGNWRITFFFILHSLKQKAYFMQMQVLFVCQQHHFWQLNSSQLRLWLNLSTSPLWAHPNVLVAIAKPEPPPALRRVRGSCVWPAVLAGPTNWLISLPHGAGGGRTGGLWEERVGCLAIGCNSAQLVMMLTSVFIFFPSDTNVWPQVKSYTFSHFHR